MPRDWPDPRLPAARPLRWYHVFVPAAVTLYGLVAFLVGLWPS